MKQDRRSAHYTYSFFYFIEPLNTQYFTDKAKLARRVKTLRKFRISPWIIQRRSRLSASYLSTAFALKRSFLSLWYTELMNILITGATGLIGRNLSVLLTAAGHAVVPLVRGDRKERLPWWDPVAGEIDLSPCGVLDAVVHLAGESVVGRWTVDRKRKIRDSRVKGTRLLAEALAELRSPPRTFLQASAVGYYGDRGNDVLDERSDPGNGFLPETCVAWEAAGEAAEKARIRRVRMRIGVVMTPKGGALKRM